MATDNIRDFDFKDADLGKSSIIEASAGTGKTYTLEQIVCKLIENYSIDLTKMLLVTFTNKATRELQERIRSKLQARVQELDPEDPKHKLLSDNLHNFQDANIYTIHSFCSKLIANFPLSMGLPFALSDDESTYKQAMRELILEQLRSYQRPDKKLEREFKFLQRFSQKANNSSHSNLESLLSTLSSPNLFKMLKGTGAISLYPGTAEIAVLENLEQDFNRQEGGLYRAWTLLSSMDWNSTELFDARKNGGLKVLNSLTKLENIRIFAQVHKAADFNTLMEVLFKPQPKQNGILALHNFSSRVLEERNQDKDINEWQHISRVHCVDNFLEELGFLYDAQAYNAPIYQACLVSSLLYKLQTAIQEKVQQRQQQLGLIDFDDLINIAHKQLKAGPHQNKDLLNALKSNYRIVLIDEFQDTDPRQWDLFYQIFGQDKEHNYILVGDPKQSIYQFRGANLNVYNAAYKVTEQQFCLPKNYRSNTNIISCCNYIFAKIWANSATQKFVPVTAGNPDSAPLKYKEGPEPALSWLKCISKEAGGFKGSENKTAYFMAVRQHIQILLNDKNYKLGAKAIRASDIAILLDRNADCTMMNSLLAEWNIASVVYKQDSLFASKEASEFIQLLETIADYKNQNAVHSLLLCSYFDLNAREIVSLTNNGGIEFLLLELNKWRDFLDRGQLMPVINELVQINRALCKYLDSSSERQDYLSKSYFERILQQPYGYRAHTNIHHLIELLTKEQTQKKLNCAGLLLVLMQLKEEAKEEQQRLEFDGEAIQILTAHSAKGLEFPIIFSGIAFQNSFIHNKIDSIEYDEASERIIDLAMSSQGKKRYNIEKSQEFRRLLYVVLTRAKSKIYLPLVPKSSGRIDFMLSLYAEIFTPRLSYLDWQAADKELLSIVRARSTQIYGEVEQAIRRLTEQQHDLFELRELNIEELRNPVIKNNGLRTKEHPPDLLEARSLDPDINLSYPHVSSFSSISSIQNNSYSSNMEDLDREVGLYEHRVQESDDDSPIDKLIAGPRFGLLMHSILEDLDFNELHDTRLEELKKDTELTALLASLSRRYFKPEWVSSNITTLVELVWNILHTPISILANNTLSSLKATQYRKELEFLLDITKAELPLSLDIPGKEPDNVLKIQVQAGFVRGFIDLIFEYENKIYILDWKTNKAPLNIHGHRDYTLSKLAIMMAEHHYYLQYKLYLAAIFKYIQNIKGADFDYNKDFGGCLYLFVRGMHADKIDSGVYFNKPKLEELRSFMAPFS